MMRAVPPAPQPRHIWLCADDYGIAPGVNGAIRDLIARGRINATSVMVMAPSFSRSEAEALAGLNEDEKRVAIGLHVTLTAPFKPMTSGYGPLREGAFPAARSHAARRLPAAAEPRPSRHGDRDADQGLRHRLSDARRISSTVTSMCICFRRCATLSFRW